MLKEEWEKRRALVEEGLLRELREEEAFDARLAESMKYSLLAGGKRLRPILLMAAADAVGGCGEDFLPSACARFTSERIQRQQAGDQVTLTLCMASSLRKLSFSIRHQVSSSSATQ